MVVWRLRLASWRVGGVPVSETPSATAAVLVGSGPATARLEHHLDGGADGCIQSHAARHARVVNGPMYFCSCAAS